MYLVIILRRSWWHVLEMSSHIHVLNWAIGGSGVGVDAHSLHLLYW